jgi:peptide-methionine (R)-S-oxide reductase
MSVVDRRQALVAIASACGLAPLAAWLTGSSPGGVRADEGRAVHRTDAGWRSHLTPAQYAVLRRGRTERAFSSPLHHETGAGTYSCAGCGQALFSSDCKFDSGTGWPSFWQPMDGAIETDVDRSWLMVRTEVHCARCGGHLGHVFPNGPRPTGLRYCINGTALRFLARS